MSLSNAITGSQIFNISAKNTGNLPCFALLYDKWRYNYPQYDDTQITATVPSQEFSDAMVKAFKDRIKD